MKVGILTYHWVANFGANLQTLSTINFIINRGDEPVVINWIPKDLEKIYNLRTASNQMEVHKKFAEDFYPVTNICRNSDDIADVIRENHIESVIVGSDAVLAYIPFIQRFKLSRRGLWYYRPAVDSDFPNPFWGEFIPSIPIIPVVLMSASAQHTRFNSIISKAGKKKFSNALKQFSYISVRDVWTKKMLNYLTNSSIDPEITPDPVFAFNQNHPAYFSREEILKKFNLPEKYILFTASPKILTDKWIKEIERIFLDDGYVSFELPKPDGLQNLMLSNQISLPVSPLEWYYLIKYSGGYIGELMHPILVSLHNAVPFFSFDTYGFKERGKFIYESSKVYHILNKYGLLSNYYSLLQHSKFPTPKDVFSAIKNFNFQKCTRQSELMHEDYKSMMDEMYNHLIIKN